MRFKKPLFLSGVVLLPLVVGATSPQMVRELRMLVTTATGPILEFQSQSVRWLESGAHFLTDLPTLYRQKQALQSELSDLKKELVGWEETKQEKARLESLLVLKQKIESKSVAVRVIARDPSHWSQFVVINRGLKDGVTENMALIHPDGLVGKVVAAGAYSARAILLTDLESHVSALNQRTRDVGLLDGTGSGLLKMTYLDRQSKIQIGDTIISSGLGGIYPKGIPIGQVQLVGEEKDHLSLYAMVKPFASFSKLEELLCVSSRTNG